MNALMTIQVRVLSASALAQLRAVEAQSRKTAGGVGAIGRQAQFGLPWLSKWGNQVQWAGRQLIYNFTLPIALAIGAATKFALENEKAMTRVIKVYGDGSPVFQRLAKTEIPALTRAFEALSNQFGVQQSEVINIAADWAAAGASGIALAKSVKLTLETMVLGELNAADATRQLIAIQAQYGMGVEQLSDTIGILNMVENQSGTTMKDLMNAMSRAAGVARVAGVDIEHLAAMTAALVPSAGTASNAGNALKTIISRILSPTREAVDVLREMGIAVDSTAWTSQNATERIEMLSKEFINLSDAQKTHMATVLGSRWQLNRLVILMQAVNNENSYYHKALDATSDAQAVFNQKQFELRKVLESNPQRMKQAWTIIQNSMTRVIVPLLPFITYLASELARLGNWFANLSGEVQKFVLAGLVLLALIGPIARYTGSIANLFGIISAAIHFAGVGLLKFGGFLGGLVAGPFKLLLTGLRLLNYAFWYSFYTAVLRSRAILTGFFAWTRMLPALNAATWAAMVASWRAALVVMQATTLTFMAAQRSIWAAHAMGILVFQRAFAMTLQAIWALMSLRIVAITGAMMHGVRVAIVAGAALLANPWVAAGLAILGVAYHFRDQLAEAWSSVVNYTQQAFGGIVDFFQAVGQGIVDAFWMLPEGVRNALLTVLTMVRDVALQIYEWMSYLNPFARHSPSLVESVTAGMDIIERQYQRAAGLGSVFANAARDLAAFKREAGRGNEFAEERRDVRKGRGNVGLFDRLQRDLQGIQPILNQQEAAVARQEVVVNRWQKALDAANAALDAQQYKLDRLQNQLQSVQMQFDAHRDAMQSYADAPIAGMGAMEDKIFQNEIAQKRLRLEMMRWEDVNGSIDDVRGRMDALYGDIEMLRGRAAELRQGGAGSDILGPINQQIAAMEAQAKALRGSVDTSPMAQMQGELEKLQQQGEILDLQKSIKYDPMIREIDKLANAQKELTFNEIINGIKGERAAMAALQPTINQLTAAVAQQQRVVDSAEASRDVLQRRYDVENDKLQKLQDTYQQTQDVVRDLESALRDMGQAGADAIRKQEDKARKLKDAADKAKKARAGAGVGADLPVAVETFRAGAGGNWPDPGSNRPIGREGGFGDQSKLIDQFTEDSIAEMNSIFGGFDMFGPLKRMWATAWGWLKENVGPSVTAVGDAITGAFGSIGNPFGGSDGPFLRGAKTAFSVVVDVVRTAIELVVDILRLFLPDARRIWDAIITGFQRIWDKIGPQLAAFGELWEPILGLLKVFWDLVKMAAFVLIGMFLPVIKLVASAFSHMLGPAIELVIDVAAQIIRIVRGVLQVIVGILTLDGQMVIDGFKNIFFGILRGIGEIFDGLWDLVKGLFWGIVRGIQEAWVWLKDVLIGHSIIPDIVDGIFKVFRGLIKLARWLWSNVLRPVFDAFVTLWKTFVRPALRLWWAGITAVLRVLFKLGRWMWDHVLKPVFLVFRNLWREYVRPSLSTWWNAIKTVWRVLANLGGWFWSNVLRPVFTKVRELWTVFVRPALQGWWAGLKTAWNGLRGAARWIWDNVMKPVRDKFAEGWRSIRDWFRQNSDMVLNPIRAVVRGIVTAINWMIKGLNKLDALPGLKFHINELTLPFASGGNLPTRRANRGLKTVGARAIVGEGKANYPEYVIPTDPTYRSRAQALLAAASDRLDMAAIPKHANGGLLGAIGGAFGKAKDWGGDAVDWMGNKARRAASKLFIPFKKLAEARIDRIDWSTGRQAGRAILGKVWEWVKGADRVFEQKMESFGSTGGPIMQVNDPSNPRALSIWKGGTFSNRFIAHLKAAEKLAGVAINVTQGGWRPTTKYSGTSHHGDAVDLQTGIALIKALRRVGIAAGDRTGMGNWGPHTHAIPSPQAGWAGGSGVWQYQDYLALGGQSQAYNSRWGMAKLAQGGIVRRTRGGIPAWLGDGRTDEAVTPLPRNWRNTLLPSNGGSGDTHVHLHGDLVLPNITSGDDAQELIDNLALLAKD